MQRWNPYETVLGVNNVGTLELKWSQQCSWQLIPILARRGKWGGLYRLATTATYMR